MSHQVIITFDIDENKISENAEKEAGRQIARQIIDKTFGSSYSSEPLMRRYVQKVISEMLEPNREQIIDDAIKEVVGNIHRTKAFKEKFVDAT